MTTKKRFKVIWLVVSTPLKNIRNESSQYMGKEHVPNHQSVMILDFFIMMVFGACGEPSSRSQ
jgi:hypothetical protein